MSMTHKERFLKFMRHEPVDRFPVWSANPRASTIAAWLRQGLTEEQAQDFYGFIGIDPQLSGGFSRIWERPGLVRIAYVDVHIRPKFEERTLEVRGNKKIWIDELGVKRLDHVEPATPGFVTRSYLEFPVKDRDSWHEMRRRYDPDDPARIIPPDGGTASPEYYENKRERFARSTSPESLVLPGFFWTLRDWCGFEGLCMMFAEKPGLVHEMMDYYTDFLIKVLEKPLRATTPDYVVTNEDMSYKTASMISPAMMREFMVPCYRRLCDFLRDCGVQLIVMDSDGHVSEIIEVFLREGGIDGIQPIEIAAGNDPEVYLAKYGKDICMWGGIDKRELRFDKARTRAEVVRRYRAARKYLGYIPRVDHGTPPDVPVRNFLYMVELMRGFARGEDLDTYEPPCELEAQLGPIEEMWQPSMALPADAKEGES